MGIVLILNFRPVANLIECVELLAISINSGLLESEGFVKGKL
ncbi:hypothetical protein PANNVG_00596 [Pantoea sp. Nvir]